MDASADVTCQVTSFRVESYEHGGALVSGTIGGNYKFLSLCSGNGVTSNCDTRATDRSLAIAMTALTTGRKLLAYFSTENDCASVPNYSRAYGWFMAD